MENKFLNKINLKFLTKKNFVFRKKIFSPHRVWKKIKKTFLLLFVLVIGFGIFMFIVVDKNLFSKINNNTEVLYTEINQDLVVELVNILKNKKINFEYYLTSESEVVDPYQN